jgi:hypothetical protein
VKSGFLILPLFRQQLAFAFLGSLQPDRLALLSLPHSLLRQLRAWACLLPHH